MTAELRYQCCYCDKEIEVADRCALRVTVSGLWSDDGPLQDLFAHSQCAADKLAASLSRTVPFDVETFEPD